MSNFIVDGIYEDVLKYKYLKAFSEYMNEKFRKRNKIKNFERYWGIGTSKVIYVDQAFKDCLEVSGLPAKNEKLNKEIVDFIISNSGKRQEALSYLDLLSASTISFSEQQHKVAEDAAFYPEDARKAWNKYFGKQEDEQLCL